MNPLAPLTLQELLALDADDLLPDFARQEHGAYDNRVHPHSYYDYRMPPLPRSHFVDVHAGQGYHFVNQGPGFHSPNVPQGYAAPQTNSTNLKGTKRQPSTEGLENTDEVGAKRQPTDVGGGNVPGTQAI
jgi:hypothetical protein